MNDATAHPKPVVAAYGRLVRWRTLLMGLIACLVAATTIVDVATGPAGLTVSEVLAAILRVGPVPPQHDVIVWTFRMPTALMAVVVGAALGVAGAEMQTILNNPLASPYTLGVSASAGFGAALAVVLGAGTVPLVETLALPVSAFAMTMLCSLTIYALAMIKGASRETIILGGVALLFLFNAGVGLLQYVASEEQLAAITFWIFGSLQGATWPKLAVVAVTLSATVPLLAVRAWKLTALRLGDDRASSLGVNARRLRLTTLVLVSLLAAVAVCFVGTIGFIGFVGPHLARMMVGEDQRFFMPLSGLAGAFLLSIASIASKSIFPGAVFPIGIATALMGVPFFGAMVLLRRRSYW
ncbi:MAG: iron ABC transporter permease [Phycisphaerae bacterium]|nr:iron ABC transporter permease [Phycisphaerae bacterium]